MSQLCLSALKFWPTTSEPATVGDLIFVSGLCIQNWLPLTWNSTCIRFSRRDGADSAGDSRGQQGTVGDSRGQSGTVGDSWTFCVQLSYVVVWYFYVFLHILDISLYFFSVVIHVLVTFFTLQFANFWHGLPTWPCTVELMLCQWPVILEGFSCVGHQAFTLQYF